jgi:hypothetical protein
VNQCLKIIGRIYEKGEQDNLGRQGKARLGRARRGKAVLARSGEAWHGKYGLER